MQFQTVWVAAGRAIAPNAGKEEITFPYFSVDAPALLSLLHLDAGLASSYNTSKCKCVHERTPTTRMEIALSRSKKRQGSVAPRREMITAFAAVVA